MAGFSTPFLAISSEIASLTRTIAGWEGVMMTAETFRPSSVETLHVGDVDAVVPRSDRILFTLETPAAPETEAMDILYANPGALVLDVRIETADELRSSRLSCKDPDARVLKIWQLANRALKRMTSAGATAVNPDTGAEGWDRNQRFTAGAEAFWQRGGTLRPFAGTNVYRVGPR